MNHSRSHILSISLGKMSRAVMGLLFFVLLGSAALAEETAVPDGPKIYKKDCASCHSGGVKGFLAKAPKTGKDSAWEKYFQGGTDQAVSDVFAGTKKHQAIGKESGYTKAEIAAAVQHIVSSTPALAKAETQTD